MSSQIAIRIRSAKIFDLEDLKILCNSLTCDLSKENDPLSANQILEKMEEVLGDAIHYQCSFYFAPNLPVWTKPLAASKNKNNQCAFNASGPSRLFVSAT